jgi:aminoglycoside phosphotransferase (APT) family kinase protein
MSSSPASHTREAFAQQIAAVMGVDAVAHLRRLSGGASRETWQFDVDDASFILQRVRPQRPGGLGSEATVLTQAFTHGVPVPELVVDGSVSTDLERPFMIVKAVPGETIARKILRDEHFVVARQNLVSQLGSALAKIHNVPTSGLQQLVVEDQLEAYQKILLDMGEPHPVFDVVCRWLEKNRPSSTHSVLVHGDFRLGNVVVGATGLHAVLDWELAHLGDPMEDLGWLCVRAWRFGGALPVAGLGEYEELFDAYERESGVRPNREVVRWWEILATLKWGIMCIVQAHTHLSGASRSHELAAIGRRVCENEYDLIRLLEGVPR